MRITLPSGSADIADKAAICAGMLDPPAGISMRELDPPPTELPACAVVGAGRMGTAMAAGLRAAGPLRRGEPIPGDVAVVLLTVPDGQIAGAAAKVPAGPLIGHCSGATGLEVLGDREAFSLHPLMSVPTGGGPELFAGAGAAIDGTTPRARATAEALARALGMNPAHVAPQDRVAYHAAAAIASNFLVALEGVAEDLARTAGISREQLAPLVLATARQWAQSGARRALTGPIVRGDEEVVARHRAVVAERTPHNLALWDALADATRALAAGSTVTA
jgi:predicted short-subunit dehydrogenase-like oxidoreductase (DUF2520 family)